MSPQYAERLILKYEAALRRIAFDPIGHAAASDREVLNACTEIARAALETGT